MTVTIMRGDARRLALADNSVDLIVTSPPYFGLRSYQDGGQHYEGQIGDEATPAEFVDALIACTAEWMRVLKPSGSMWVNLGDKYAGGGGQWDKDERPDPQKRRAASGSIATGGKSWGHKPKTLMGIPWRYALRCIDDLGLILRAEVIWSKPNGLPESVTDRVRRSHEQWFHMVMQPRYFSAVDEIREPHKPGQSPSALSFAREGRETAPGQSCAPHRLGRDDQGLNPLGKLPGSVWTVPTEPLRVPEHLGIDHFAAFPTEWPKRIIQGWSPAGVCVECGEERRPVVESQRHRNGVPVEGRLYGPGGRFATATGRGHVEATERHLLGYTCGCAPSTEKETENENSTLGPLSSGGSLVGGIRAARRADPVPPLRVETVKLPPTRPAVVLDPFGGTGTTALVAHALGRHGISNDMSADYCRLARWRTSDPAQLAKVLGVPKPPEQVTGQADLFGEDVA